MMRVAALAIVLAFAAGAVRAQADLLVTAEMPLAPPVEAQPACTGASCPEVGISTAEGALPALEPGGTLTVFSPVGQFAFPSVAKMVAGNFGFTFSPDGWEGQGGCTSVLIHPRVILTAQHCVINAQGQMIAKASFRFRKTQASAVHTESVTLSMTNVALRIGGFDIQPDGTARFSDEFDLAMVLLNEPVPDAAVRVVRVATEADLASHTRLTFVGFGMQLINLATGGTPAERRLGFLTNQIVPMTISSGSLLARAFRIRATFEVNGSPVSAAVCNGDSGGPFFLARPEAPSQMVVVGINHAVTLGNSPQACATHGTESFIVGLIGNRNFIDAGLAKFGLQ